MFKISVSLFTLFSLSFLASTLLPGGSEFYFSYLILSSNYSSLLLILIATLGNTLGGFTNWIIGRFAIKYWTVDHKPTDRMLKAQQWLQKWGAPSLLLSWMPIIGDPLCLVAGLFRIYWFQALAYIFIGKLLRYTILSFLLN